MSDPFDFEAVRKAIEEKERQQEAFERKYYGNGAAAKPDWWEDCITGKGGLPLALINNACVALERAGVFRGQLCFNEMSHQAIVRGSDPHPVTDYDTTELQCELQRQGVRIGFQVAAQAIDTVARKYPYHPIADVLDGLAWDGLPRLDSWLANCLGCEPSEYHSMIGRMFLIAMVARVLDPGCKADYMLILEGPQGSLKSQACRLLAGDAYFSDHLPDLATAGKDISIHLRGKWLIEVAEMHAFSRAETTLLKSFLSRTTEIFRSPYGRIEAKEQRQCLFIGTSNHTEYLRDETGGRRFWPVTCGTINLPLLDATRDQLFAEAVNAFHNDERHWPSRDDETRLIRPQQEARYEEDIWQPLVEEYITMLSTVRLVDIAINACGVLKGQLGTTQSRRIAAILRRLGWVRAHTEAGKMWQRSHT